MKSFLGLFSVKASILLLSMGEAFAGSKGSSGGMPQLDATTFPSQLFWLAITFGVLYYVFSTNILPTLSNILENRHTTIQNDLDQAESVRKEAEKVHEAYEEILNEAHIQSSELFAKTDEQIKDDVNKTLAKFKEKADKAMDEAETTITGAKTTVMDEMHTIAAEIASEAAEKIVGISTDVSAAKTVIQNISKKAA